jgi:hypothetical protein
MLPVSLACNVVVAPLHNNVASALTEGCEGELPVLNVIVPLWALPQLLDAIA